MKATTIVSDEVGIMVKLFEHASAALITIPDLSLEESPNLILEVKIKLAEKVCMHDLISK